MLTIPGTRPDERFFQSRFQPRVLLSGQLLVGPGIARFTVWGPWPFLSVVCGVQMDEAHGWGFQAYAGIKADGTQSLAHGFPVMVLTPKEFASLRFHTFDLVPVWTNQAGA